ncbi:MAG: AAA family ATPase, partial [Acidimicrobiia bacterium]
MRAEWPLVGREAELHQLGALVLDKKAVGAVIIGPPGVGKTRLLEECLHMAGEAGIPSSRVRATKAAARLPFGALAPLLPVGPGEGDGNGGPVLLSRLAAALTEQAKGQRFVLVVDDAHLLDDPSAAFVHQLALTGAACVLVTARSGEAVPDLIVGLWKEGLAERIELGALDVGTGERLLETVLGGPVDTAGVTALIHRCGGNILFFRELVEAARATGSLRDDDGMWRLSGAPPLSPELLELIEAQMGPLETTDGQLLEAVSFAEVLGPAELGALAEPSRVEDLVRRGLLSSRMDRRRVEVQLASPLYGDLLRSRIPAVRLPRTARTLVEAVEACGSRRRDDKLRVASWSFVAGLQRPELMLSAAHTARWRYDFALAERLVEAACDDGAGFDAALLRAQLACLRGRTAESARQLTLLAEQAGDDGQRGVLAVSLIDTLAVYKGWMDEGLRLADRLESDITDEAWRDEIAARRAVLVLATEGPRASVELAIKVVGRAEGRGLVWGCMGAAFGLARLGRVTEALAMTERGHAEHLALVQPIDRYPWIHSWLRCEALVQAGRLREAETLARACYAQGVEDASAEAQAYFAWHLATVVGERGHVQSAARYAREGIALNRELGRPHYVRECLVGLALASALAGHAREAAQALTTLDALDLPDAMFKPGELALARGWAAVAAGDVNRAAHLFGVASLAARQRGDLV